MPRKGPALEKQNPGASSVMLSDFFESSPPMLCYVIETVPVRSVREVLFIVCSA
jgi:hypothetical protein